MEHAASAPLVRPRPEPEPQPRLLGRTLTSRPLWLWLGLYAVIGAGDGLTTWVDVRLIAARGYAGPIWHYETNGFFRAAMRAGGMAGAEVASVAGFLFLGGMLWWLWRVQYTDDFRGTWWQHLIRWMFYVTAAVLCVYRASAVWSNTALIVRLLGR
jgi:hypothetical protein